MRALVVWGTSNEYPESTRRTEPVSSLFVDELCSRRGRMTRLLVEGVPGALLISAHDETRHGVTLHRRVGMPETISEAVRPFLCDP